MNDEQRSPLSLVDKDNCAYILDTIVLRPTSPSLGKTYLNLEQSGLLADLIEEQYIPETSRSATKVFDSQIVLEHHRYPVLTYPFEWSSLMLKEAGSLVAKFLERLRPHGYSLKDCHPYNIVFNGAHPVYVDFGSIIRTRTPYEIPWQEFVSNYYYPLLAWEKGCSQYSRLSLAHFGLFTIPVDEHIAFLGIHRLRNRLFTRARLKLAQKATGFGFNKKVSGLLVDKRLRGLVSSNKPLDMLDLMENVKPYSRTTVWANYQDRYLGTNSLLATKRYHFLIRACADLKCSSAVDLACNQGYFAEALFTSAGIGRVCGIDNDPAAIDSFYKRILDSSIDKPLLSKSVHPILAEIIPNPAISSQPSLHSRCRSELVTALAITHHLALGMQFSFSTIIKSITGFASEYMIIEFMPKGLWAGQGPFPSIPEWYTKDAFLNALQSHCKAIQEHHLEVNRIAYVCTLK